MINSRNISVCIPHYNNAQFMLDTLKFIKDDIRITEIIICDDNSKDIKELEKYLIKLNIAKIKLYKNIKNIGSYLNKLESISKCSNKWCLLLDSDNFINKNTIDILYSINEWNENIIYAPSWPKTFPGKLSLNLDYRVYQNKLIDKAFCINNFENIKFQCLLNNCNYFLPVENFLLCMNKYKNNYTREFIGGVDSLFLSCSWFKENYKILIVENFIYNHRVHKNSFYMLTDQSNIPRFKNKILIMLKNN